MGALLAKWRAKPSTVEVLEKMEKDIQSLEEFSDKNQKLLKIWVARLFFYSSILYIITSLAVYLLYLPDGMTARLLTTLLFMLFPVLIWFVRTLLILWFSRRTERNNDALEIVKAEKKKIIQDLRQRTAAQRNISVSTPVNPDQESPQVPGLLAATPALQRDTSGPGGPPERSVQPTPQSNILQRRPGSPVTAVSGMALHPPGPPLARPILPRERGAMDRVIEYLVGDGPQNRYALICLLCFSHNGMELKEEFEYVAFRCAYCYFLNPARKTRPQAPRLQEINFDRQRHRTDSQGSVSALQPPAAEQQESQHSPLAMEENSPVQAEDKEIEEDSTCSEQQWEKVPDDSEKDKSSVTELNPPLPAPAANEREESFM
ncbi:endoplasmic reticulum junction formation protein lunapark [Xenopus laevis]|uniref:Endoplasmic reticulum junction formation protein lunapark n=1 Tax=Xenopus laevis TaxID=8355 RepID=A0A8J0TZK1_XENLA|nr:endoplasmic reticulum junction formation protein lunapark [Xenopus laevis]